MPTVSLAQTGISQFGRSLPDSTYVYSVRSLADPSILTPNHPHLATISSDNKLRLFKSQDLKDFREIERLHDGGGVTCVEVYGQGGGEQLIVTAGRDGTVKGWDPRGTSRVFELKVPSKQGISFSALACSSEANLLAAGEENESEGGEAPVYVWDLRGNPSSPIHTYADMHLDAVTALQFHPTRPSTTLLSAGGDGLINIYNLIEPDDSDALTQVFNHGSGLRHAGWYGQESQLVYGISADEQVKVWEYDESSEEGLEQKRVPVYDGGVRGLFGQAYVAKVVKNAQGEWWVAAGDLEQQTLSLYPLYEDVSRLSSSEHTVLALPGAHGEELVRDVIWQDSRVYTCGEDGMVRVWDLPSDFGAASAADQEMQDGSEPEEEEEEESDDRPKKKRRTAGESKRKHRKSKSKSHFKPY